MLRIHALAIGALALCLASPLASRAATEPALGVSFKDGKSGRFVMNQPIPGGLPPTPIIEYDFSAARLKFMQDGVERTLEIRAARIDDANFFPKLVTTLGELEPARTELVLTDAPKVDGKTGNLVIDVRKIKLRRTDDATGSLSEATLHWMVDRQVVQPEKGQALLEPYVRKSYPFNPALSAPSSAGSQQAPAN